MSYADTYASGLEPEFPTSPVTAMPPRTAFPPVINMKTMGGNSREGLLDYPDLSTQVILNFPAWRNNLMPPQKAAVDGQFSRSQDPARTTQRMQDDIWLAERTGYPLTFIAANRDAVVSAYGRANNIPDWQDPGKLHAFIVKQAQADFDEHTGIHGPGGDTEDAVKLRKASLVQFAYDAAHQNASRDTSPDKKEDEASAWAQFQAEAKSQKWWRPENTSKYFATFHSVYEQGRKEVENAEAMFERLKPVLTGAVEKGRKEYMGRTVKSGDAPTLGNEPGFDEATKMMRRLTGQEKQIVLERIAAWTPKAGESRGFAGDVNLSAERGFADVARGVADAAAKVANALTDPASPDHTDPTTLVEEQNLRKQLVNAALGKLDPVDTSTYGRFALNKAAESAGVMIGAAIPVVGPIALAGGYASDFENKAVANGMSLENARGMSVVIGPLQAAADMVELKLFKQLGMGKLFSGISGKAAAAYGVRVAEVTAGETVIELAQDQLIPAVVQDVGHWWDKNIPGIKWIDVAKEAWAQTPDTLLTMLPIAALLGGVGHISDVKNAGQLVKNPERLDMLGYSKESIAKVQGLSTDDAERKARVELLAQPDRLRALGYSAQDIADMQAQETEDAVRVFREEWSRRTPRLKGDYKGAGISEGAETVANKMERRDNLAMASAAPGLPGGPEVSKKAGAPPLIAAPETAEEPPAELDAFPLRKDDNGWFVENGAARIDAGSFDAAKHLQNQLRMAVTAEGAQAWLDIADDLTGRKAADTVTLSGRAVEAAQTPAGTAVTSVKPGGAAETIKLTQESLKQLDEEMKAAGLTLATIQGSNEAIRDTLGRVSNAITANIGPDGVLTLIHEAAERQFRAGRVTKAETQAAAQALLPVFAHDAEISGALQGIAAGDTTSAGAQETMMGILVSNELGQRKDGRRFKPGALTAGFMDALRMQGGEKARSGVRKYAAMAQAIGKYFKALFSGMKALARARKGGADLKDFDAFADKLLGIDPDKRAAVESAKEAAGMLKKEGVEVSDFGGPTEAASTEAAATSGAEASAESSTNEVEIHTLSKGEITLAKKPATKELLRDLSKQEGMYKQLIDCLKK